MTRYLIKGGRLIDGLGSCAKQADVLIRGDRIEAIGPIQQVSGAKTIDATDKIVCPAFIDIHRHLDAKALSGSSMEVELRQGIATAVAGNCGFSLAPGYGPFAAQKRKNDLPILGNYPEHYRFSFPAYMEALESSHPDLNLSAMIGLGAVRICLSGFSDIPLTQKQLENGRDMIKEALSCGAPGVSAGIMYLPEFYTKKEEYKVLLQGLKGGKKPLVTHIRGEGDSLAASIEEVLQIAKEAECPLEISHFKSCGMQNWNKEIHRAIEKIETARARGQDVTVDFYPYLGGSTALTTMLPPAFVQGDMQRALERLDTPEGVASFRSACSVPYSDWDNYAISLGWDRILIASTTEANRRFQGLSVEDAAQAFGFEDAAAAAAYLMHSENGQTAIINLSMDQQDVDTIARLDYSTLISDSIYADTDTPHPRMFGAFPRFIDDFVRRRKVLTMETAIQKMTSMPAERMQLAHRGSLQPGSFADVLLFAEDALTSLATFQAPAQLGTGIHMLMINGQIRVENDSLINDPSGHLLKVFN